MAETSLWMLVECPTCAGSDRLGCRDCDGTRELYRDPTPADLLSDPRVAALVEALGHSLRELRVYDQYRQDVAAKAALAPFEVRNG